MTEKVIVVEGLTDKLRIEPLFEEPVHIICTNGTISPYHLEELLSPFEGDDIYLFADEDRSGDALRALFKREFSEIKQIRTDRIYKEVAKTPLSILAQRLKRSGFMIRKVYES